MRLVWTARAQAHLAALYSYIANDDPAAAARVVERIIDLAAQILIPHPTGGRPGRVQGTRELVVTGTPYIIAYRVSGDSIQILAVLHTSRRWPDAL